MNASLVLMIAISVLTGAAVSYGSAVLRIRWPVSLASILIAAAALLQLRGLDNPEGFARLGAFITLWLMLLPALMGLGAGAVLARATGRPLGLSGWLLWSTLTACAVTVLASLRLQAS